VADIVSGVAADPSGNRASGGFTYLGLAGAGFVAPYAAVGVRAVALQSTGAGGEYLTPDMVCGSGVAVLFLRA
jgi:hypothetical protein